MNQMKHLPLIGIMGPAGAGKDTAADYLLERCPAIKRAMAKPLYDMVNAFFADVGIIPKWHDRAWKEGLLPGFDVSPRHMLQQCGTEWGRGLRPDFWHLPMLRAIASAKVYLRGVVIPDVRFDDEAELVLENGGFLLHIDSPWVEPVKDHISNQPVWERFPCWVIKNEHGDLPGMRRKLDAALSHYLFGG
jgi:hypothetical protein